MRNLNDYAKRCMRELDDIGIEYGNIIEFKVNTRAKKRWGQCKAVHGGYSISINAVLLDDKNSEEGLKNTIIHELLHSCKGCMNHGENWKRMVQKVHQAYGYNIKRTSSVEEMGIASVNPIIERKINHKVICLGCGCLWTRTRTSKLITNTDEYRCGKCNGKLKLEF